MNNRKNKIFIYVLTIFIFIQFNLILSQDTSDEDDNGKIGTFRSAAEFVIEELASSTENAGNGTLIGKTFSQVLDLFGDQIQAIFPGTQWCGAGNKASNENDLGVFNKTDACCREHDNCPDSLPAGESKGRLINNGIFTRSACFCDHAFYDCLKNADTPVSTAIGVTYFDILRPQCFANDYPITSCARRDKIRLFRKKCLEYNQDKSQDKILQWFDNPDY